MGFFLQNDKKAPFAHGVEIRHLPGLLDVLAEAGVSLD